MTLSTSRAFVLTLVLPCAALASCSSSASSTATPTSPTTTAATAATPVVKPALGAPVAASPLTGTTVAARPTLTVQNATRTGTVTGAVTYAFEVADNPSFTPVAASSEVPEGSERTAITLSADLVGGRTYFWRVTAFDGADGLSSPPSEVQTITVALVTQARQIAEQQGVVLWPGAQPTGTPGHARFGPGWGIGSQTSFNGVTFQSPPIEALRVFDLLDLGLDPDAALGWLRVNGYPTVGAYYASVQAIGFPYQYMALIGGAWELVHRVGA